MIQKRLLSNRPLDNLIFGVLSGKEEPINSLLIFEKHVGDNYNVYI